MPGSDRSVRFRSCLTGLVRAAATATVISLVGGLGAVPAQAGVGEPMLEIRGQVPIHGLPATWRMELYASHSAAGVDIGLALRTRNKARTAVAEQDWSVDQGTVTCTASFSSCSIKDQGAFGSYGRVRLTFSPRKPVRTTQLHCTGSDIVYATRVSRRGVLKGTLRLSTGVALSGVIRNGSGAHRVPAAIPVVASRTAYTGSACPLLPENCVEEAGFWSVDYRLSTRRRLPTGPVSLSMYRTPASAVPTVSRTEWVWFDRPVGSALTVSTPTTLVGATVDLSSAAPFLSGELSFLASGGKVSSTHLGCADEERPGTVAEVLTMRMPGRPKVKIDQLVPGTIFHVLP